MNETTLQYFKVFYSDRKEADKLIAALDRQGVLPVFSGENKQVRAYSFHSRDLKNITGVAELLHSTPGIVESVLMQIESSECANETRNQGGGWVQSTSRHTEYRCILRDGKSVADVTLPGLEATVLEAFARLKKDVPEAIREAIK